MPCRWLEAAVVRLTEIPAGVPAAFELLVFEAFCYRTQMRAVKNMLWTNYPGMVKKLGMKFEYR